MNTSEIRSFGGELRAFRERKRMSQFELARALGVNRQTIVAWELSKNPPRDRTRVLELAGILGLDGRETNMLLVAAFLDPLPAWHVPSHQNPLFTGREELLQELHRVLVPGMTAAVTQSRAISGLGGVGKTQAALEYVYRYRNDYSAVLWLQADSHEILSLACLQLAQELGLPGRSEADQARIVAAVRLWLKSKTKWLLVLDNVEDLAMIEEFLPSGHHGCVLLTTLVQAVPEHIALVHKLEGLPEEEGVLLLLRRAGLLALDAPLGQATPSGYAQAKELWELVEGLPLALDQIGGYIRATGCGLARYRRLYVDQQRYLDLLKLRGKIPPGHPESVVTTFSVAFEKVSTLNPAAADLLRVCALLHPKAIPEEIIMKGGDWLGPLLSSLAADPLLLDQAIDALQTYSLIHRDAQESTLSVHRLVQAIIVDTMDRSTQILWAERVLKAIDTVFPLATHANWMVCDRYITHALHRAKSLEQWSMAFPEAIHLLSRAGGYLFERARYKEAEVCFQRALRMCEQLLSLDHPDTAICLSNLAGLYRRQGKYVEAETLFQQALSIQKRQFDLHNQDSAASLDGLALLYLDQGNYTKAEPLFKSAITVREQVLGADHPELAISLNNLSLLYFALGKFVAAEQLLQRAISIWEHQDPAHPEYARCLHNLAECYRSQGKYGEIESLLQRSLAIQEQLDLTHVDVSYLLNSLAILYKQQGRYDEAVVLYRRALCKQEERLGANHPDLATIFQNLAVLYQAQNKDNEAEPLLQQALSLRESQLGASHPTLAPILYSLALSYSKQNKYVEAEALYHRAPTIQEQPQGESHPDIATSLQGLAQLYCLQGKHAQAEPLFLRAVSIRKQQLGPDHPHTLLAFHNLAIFYQNLCRYEEAKQVYLQKLETCEQHFGADHLETAFCLNNFSFLLLCQGNYGEAEVLLTRAISILDHQLGHHHPQTVALMQNYTSLLREMGRSTEAEQLEIQLSQNSASS